MTGPNRETAHRHPQGTVNLALTLATAAIVDRRRWMQWIAGVGGLAFLTWSNN
ncbi:MAG: hypothetical protein V7634_1096 [Bradyrhizobium sp.]|jgi:hypothetical protein